MLETARTLDLNADLGEGFPLDAQLLERVTSASLACAAHAGDRATVAEALRAAARLGVVVGAHPGFADREGFGRREQTMGAEGVERLVLEQVEWLSGLAAGLGVQVRYLKPHGALYNQAQRDPEIAEGVVHAVTRLGLPVLGQPGSVLESVALKRTVRFVAEGFPDRGYDRDGRLLPRTSPGAVLSDPAEVHAQVARLVGERIETLCIHGDDPRALLNAETVRAAVQALGITLKSFC